MEFCESGRVRQYQFIATTNNKHVRCFLKAYQMVHIFENSLPTLLYLPNINTDLFKSKQTHLTLLILST